MDNFDLDSIWEDEQPKAAAYFKQVAPQLPQVVRQKSQHALQKLCNTILLEWLVGLVVLAILLVLYRSAHDFEVLLGVTIGVLVIGVYPYWNLWQTIRAIPTHSLKESLIAYLKVVRLFIKRMEWFCILGMPIGVAFGMYFRFQEEAIIMTMISWTWLVGLSLLVGVLFYLPVKYWYIPLVYGRTEKQLETLLNQLTTEN
ncbi:MAG: hypothetical protein AB8E82_20335 [Aureispira sp.]